MTKASAIEFGEQAAKQFPFSAGWKNLNHGSYGAIPLKVQEAREQHLREAISQPDAFYKEQIYPHVVSARKVVAKELDADFDNVVFVTNATMGVNTVVRGYPWKKGDQIVYCNTIYGACENVLRFVEKYHGVELIKVDLWYPLSDDEVVAKYCEAFDGNNNVKLALFDAVSSVPACRIPFERLCHECREREILSLVDGAHCIGLLNGISLRAARPDFFVTNMHKWFFVPDSLAVLYVDRVHHDSVETLPTSHPVPYNQKTFLADKFAFIGTIDYSNILCVLDAVRFREQLGGEEAIIQYTTNLAQSGCDIVTQVWGDGAAALDKTVACALFNVRLPNWVNDAVPLERHAEFYEKFYHILIDRYKTHVPLYSYQGQLWSRWSAQIYLTETDFKEGASTVLKALETALLDF